KVDEHDELLVLGFGDAGQDLIFDPLDGVVAVGGAEKAKPPFLGQFDQLGESVGPALEDARLGGVAVGEFHGLDGQACKTGYEPWHDAQLVLVKRKIEHGGVLIGLGDGEGEVRHKRRLSNVGLSRDEVKSRLDASSEGRVQLAVAEG